MCDKKSRLLIIDDESEIRDVLQEFLGCSHHCVTVDSAEEALALIAKQPFDLIISDIAMENMSGLELVPHIMKIAPDSLIIMISGQRTIEFAIDAMRAGAFDYITKPFELRDVASAVRRALEHLSRQRDSHVSVNRGNAQAKELQRAIEADELVVHYQPKVSIEPGRLVGFEALVRWNHPQLGLLPPSDFVPEAEESELIEAIGATVLRKACAEARSWHDMGLDFLHVAVNISPRQFHQGDLLETVISSLSKAGLGAEHLHLELTETSLMEHGEPAVNILKKLRQRGIKIAIDDFGTGYSSLGYLKRLPIDFVKLDRSFVSGMTDNPEDAALVMASINLAHNLNLKVVAEGVESEDQRAFLRLMRCDQGQGYLFGKPLRPESIWSFLEAKDYGKNSGGESQAAKQLDLPIPSPRLPSLAHRAN
jgi:diguanylate cyclase